ncbi:MAG: hypothetical protein ABWX67_00940, partial [Allosphingosinicella sp.]
LGWYSDPDGDIAAGGTTAEGAADLLKALNWSVAADSAGTFGRSFCIGACFEMAWQAGPDAAAPADPAYRDSWGSDPARRTLNFAVGNSVVDAFTSLTNVLVKDAGMSTLLRAFSNDQLPLLNEVNGPALLDQALRRDWFASSEGGTRWTIVERDSDGKPEATLTAAEAAWLQQLNDDQAALDDILREVHSDQWNLNALWFKSGYAAVDDNFPMGPPTGMPDPKAFTTALDPGVEASPAQQLVAKLQQLRAGLAKVPQPVWAGVTNRSDAFAAGIALFAAGKSLDDSKRLKAVPAQRYWQPANPVVVISGVKPAYDADPTQPTMVRLSAQVSSSFTAGGQPVSRASAGAAFATLPALANLPDGAAALVDELFLLDPANEACLAAASGISAEAIGTALATPGTAFDGVLPVIDLAVWAQPWSPLFVEWRGSFLPIDGDAAGDWSFDGTDYNYIGSGAAPVPQEVRGRSLLSPHAQFLFGSRLKKFLDQFRKDNPDLDKIYQDIASVYKWEFLAQELVGFDDSLSGRDSRPFRRPLPTDTIGDAKVRLADLLGYDDPEAGGDALPDAMRGRVTTAPLISANPIPFQGIRQGQFYFKDLFLYDRFGRKLVLASSVTKAGVNDYKNFPAVIDTALAAPRPLDTSVTSVLQLPPRVLQPMRLDAQFLDRQDEIGNAKLVSSSPDACPVCGWIIANHLNDSLLLFAPDGTSWGDVRLVVGADGKTRTAEWAAPPHGGVVSLDDIAKASPDLAAMVGSSNFKTEANFAAFLSAIDSTLWTIDPLGGRSDQNLSVLVGRPLALVRLRLQFQLAGKPRRDTGWAATFDTAPAAWLAQAFPIRLGDQATRQDGTIGYFTGTFDSFRSVATPEPGSTQTYIQQIGSPGTGEEYPSLALTDQTYAYATVLLDPRAAIHATTGALPVLPISLPVRFVDAPLSRLEIAFRMGPLLTVLQPTATQGSAQPAFPNALTYPLPTERNGSWSWWEGAPGAATGFALNPANNSAHFLTSANSLREGVLAFTVTLAAKD